jgi:N-hydroxyarylamine O-acetyltransferase
MSLDLEPYLARIGASHCPREPTLATLARVHEAHLAAIPFENLDILLGRPIQLELGALLAKLIAAGRGGYCFEQNTLFQAVLVRLGFHVTAHAGRVRQGAPEGVMRPRTHMLLCVQLPEGPYLADVGFGGDGPVLPLPLAAGWTTWVEGTAWRLRREDDIWVLEANLDGSWCDLYAFSLEPQLAPDFELANYYTSTFPRSPFVTNLTAQRSRRDRRTILRNRELTVREGPKSRREAVRDPEHMLEVLEREFGLVFPKGTRFSKPDF